MDPSDFSAPVQALLQLGEDAARGAAWKDYRALGLTQCHASELIRLMSEDALNQGDANNPQTYAPVHAWRALGQLGVVEAYRPFLEELAKDTDDDWRRDDAADFFGLLGPAILGQLVEFLADYSHDANLRWVAASGVRRIAELHSEYRDECVHQLMVQLERFEQLPEELITGLVCELVQLKAVGAAPLIERVFAAGLVDEMMVGSWEYVQYDLGLRDKPPEHRYANVFAAHPRYEFVRSPADRAKERAKKRRKQARASRKRNRRG